MENKRLWHFPNRPALALVLGSVLSVGGFVVMRRVDERRLRADFELAAERRVAMISKHIDGDLQALSALRGFMEVRQPIGAADFDRFAARLLESHPGLLAVEWISRVPAGSRAAFEAELRRDGAGGQGITEGVPGRSSPATGRAQYYPVRFLYPRSDENRAAIGFDIGSCGSCLRALEKAKAAGRPATMPRLRTLEQANDRFGVPIVLPAYRGDAAQSREPTDYAFILLQVAGVVEEALRSISGEGINIAFFDESAAVGRRFLYDHRGRPGPHPSVTLSDEDTPVNRGQWSYAQSFPVGSRTWKLVCTPTAELMAVASTWRPWLTLLSGAFLTLAIAGYVRSKVDITALREAGADARMLTERLEGLVAERTRKLSDSETRLSTALDAVSDGFWDWDVATGEVYYSPRWIALLGYTAEDVPPKADFFFSIIHPSDRASAAAATEYHLAGGAAIQELDLRLLTKRGEYMPVNNRSRVAAWDTSGKAARVVGSIHDITERKRAEDNLLEGKRLADFSAAIGACLTQCESLDEALQACCRAMTTTLDAALARVWILSHESDMLELRASAGLYTHLNGPLSRVPLGTSKIGGIARDSRRFTTNQVHADSAIADREWARREGLQAFAGYPLLVQGTVIGVAAVFARHTLNDATVQALDTAASTIAVHIHRSQAQDALRESDERMSQILATARDAIVTMNENGILTGWNPRAETIFGWTASEALGRPMAELIVPEKLRAAHKRGLRAFLDTGHLRILNREVEFSAIRRDGSEFPVELTVVTVTVRGARQFNSFIRDITERKQLEAQLLHAQKMESVGQLAGGIAHDFNNLLTVIGGAAQLAERDLLRGASASIDIAAIRDATSKAAALTRQILAFSRKQVLQPAVVNLNDLITQTVAMLRRVIGENISITLDLDEKLWGVTLDAGQFEQVILNLAINARDAMPDGGRLTIRTRNVREDEAGAKTHLAVDGPGVLLSVSDTGTGMDEATCRNIFDPFFTTKAPGKGTGLGLSVVYGVVRQSNGDIRVSSVAGRGATFAILLPKTDSLPPPRRIAAAEPSVIGGDEAILLVEDNDMVRKMVRVLLESAGYKVHAASNGREAVALLALEPACIDLLLTDLMMPEMDGRALAEHVRASRPATRILFTSGFAGDAISFGAGEFHPDAGGQAAFIQKPYAIEELARKVREVLDA